MDERSLRRLIREEIEAALKEDAVVDDHDKFRKLVSERLGRRLVGDECFEETFTAWDDALTEAQVDGTLPNGKLLDHYVRVAVTSIKQS